MNRNFNSRRFWKKLWILLKRSHKQIIFLVFLIIIIEAVYLVGPYILKVIIDLLTVFQSEMIWKILGLVVLMFFVNQIGSFLDYLGDKKIFKILTKTEESLSKKSFKKMVYLSLNYHEKENTGSKVLKIQRGISKIIELLSNLFWEVIPTIFQIILTVITLFWVDWRFGAITCFFIPIFIVITYRTNKKVFPYRKERFSQEEKASGRMTQSIININTVKSFAQEEKEEKSYGKIIDKIIKNTWLEFGKILKSNLSRNLTIDSGRILILLFGIFLIIQGEITIGSLVFVFTISEKALISLFRISRLYDKLMESSEATEKLYDLFQERSDIENKKDGIKPDNIKGGIEFKNVDFIYKDSERKALLGVNLIIEPCSTVALVGPSGGGKTTTARMIYRHYDPNRGSIFLDGVNLKEYDLYAFRKFIGIVPQEVEIFNMSIKDNISYAKPGASLEKVKEAARIANAEEFIDKSKKGYETLVGERGLKLSGGQKQRIGIARAILANPQILIFDEATSNLDSKSEKLIQEAMENIRKNRTVIVIAHRLSTIRKADVIIVLEEGKIVEQGRHKDLIEGSGLYNELLKLQEVGDVEKD
jgi:ABC-type multidrug transport system fused ATPase/permease subunit